MNSPNFPGEWKSRQEVLPARRALLLSYSCLDYLHFHILPLFSTQIKCCFYSGLGWDKWIPRAADNLVFFQKQDFKEYNLYTFFFIFITGIERDVPFQLHWACFSFQFPLHSHCLWLDSTKLLILSKVLMQKNCTEILIILLQSFSFQRQWYQVSSVSCPWGWK